eukprot:TRINITY_DN27664_c0_g1_i1.p1 TRINITY_DN27664_c0_g1~~TRINITY_DN27664_c0_g1_i1.p1  ORF type:complete len:435 (-),score=77.03 TRINITY_DN27664_c0_g1_i1:76-1380(-)
MSPAGNSCVNAQLWRRAQEVLESQRFAADRCVRTVTALQLLEEEDEETDAGKAWLVFSGPASEGHAVEPSESEVQALKAWGITRFKSGEPPNDAGKSRRTGECCAKNLLADGPNSENNGAFACCFPVGLAADCGGFNVVSALLGMGARNLQEIGQSCNALVRLMGREIVSRDGAIGQNADVPLQLFLLCSQWERYKHAVDLVAKLLRGLYARYRKHQRSQGLKALPLRVHLTELLRSDLNINRLLPDGPYMELVVESFYMRAEQSGFPLVQPLGLGALKRRERYTCCFPLGINDADFNVADVAGGGSNETIFEIAWASGATLQLRGQGSGCREGPARLRQDQKETPPLQFLLTCTSYPNYLRAVGQVANFLVELHEHYRDYCTSNGVEPPVWRLSLIEVVRSDLELKPPQSSSMLNLETKGKVRPRTWREKFRK